MRQPFADLEAAVLQSMVDGDFETLSGLLSEDFVITTAGWLPEPASKSEWLAGVRGHTLNEFTIRSVEVRDFGALVVVLVLSRQSGTWARGDFDYDFRYTDVWRSREDGRWLLEVRHASIAPQASRAVD